MAPVMSSGAKVLLGAAMAAAVVSTATGAVAHPHVWVATRSQAVFENGALSGLRLTWLFDEMYTMTATEGLDTNKDGKIDAAEFEELLKVNIEGLKEFEYFTSVTMAGQPVPLADPKDYAMSVLEVDDAPGPQMVAGPGLPAAASEPPAEKRGLWARFTGWVSGLFGAAPAQRVPQTAQAAPLPEKSKVLSLTMTLPFKEAIPAAKLDSASKGFQFLTSDAQMYIWFEPMAKDGVGVSSGAPDGCRTVLIDPEPTEEQKKLAEAFGRVGMGGPAIIGGGGKAVAVVCR